jgi:hypothetical protein
MNGGLDGRVTLLRGAEDESRRLQRLEKDKGKDKGKEHADTQAHVPSAAQNVSQLRALVWPVATARVRAGRPVSHPSLAALA